VRRVVLPVAAWLALAGIARASEPAPPLDAIVAGMARQKQRQQQRLRHYRALRRFHAANPRFRLEASLEVETVFRRAQPLDSRIVRTSGSDLIRGRVFDRILQAERDTSDQKAKEEVEIGPANYEFALEGIEEVDGRRAYRLNLSPRRKNPYLIRGSVWVDAEDFGVMRVSGSPSKRPSFWTLRTKVERTYAKINGVWLTRRTESASDLLLAGYSTLEIEADYGSVEADP
jgi:hypothetical protein